MNDSVLDTLCRLTGIQPEYADIWGKRHHIPSAVTHALLEGMGLDAAAAPEATLAQWQNGRWRKWLAPVAVVRGSEPVAVTLHIADSEAARRFEWTLTPDQGEAQRGTLTPANLSVVEQVQVDGKGFAMYRFALPEPPAVGYYQFELTVGERHERLLLVVAPDTCYIPQGVVTGRVFGPALQLYALRSQRNWGIGDFTDLRTALELFAAEGIGVIGLNPLHAAFPHNPEHASPYSPSSRLFLNVLYIDVEAIPEFAQCEAAQQMVFAREFQKQLEALRAQELVDYTQVARAKFAVLEVLYRYFRERHAVGGSARARAFDSFRRDRGELLQRHALYEALQAHFYGQDANAWGWQVWPEPYRDPVSSAVAEFAERERERVEYYIYLQWQADSQLAAAARRSTELGLAIGLYQDLAVSVDRAGAESWALQSLYAQNVSVGAPPDEFNLVGQDWGLPPFIPHRLTEHAYGPFISTLRATMRHCGALRIDHVMGLMRLFWVPHGATARGGAYVHYPLADLLGILALESHRNQCLVIGEDLGTVPDEVRTALAALQVLSYRVFYFERDAHGEFKPPAAYPACALATFSTHDLPTLAGYWKGCDIQERAQCKLFPSEEIREQQILLRVQDRVRLLMALKREQLLPEGVTPDPASSPEMTPALVRAFHVYLARTNAKLMMFQLEDVTGQLVQVNLPATSGERPNWRRKIAVNLETLGDDFNVRALLAALREARGTGIVARAGEAPRASSIPDATYRLQFHHAFTFKDAEKRVAYLHRLGISHIYASPYLTARPGSMHGYDIVDHNTLNPEIGTRKDYERLARALQQRGMSQVLDIVPNHMGIGSDNAWWLDVLENGPASRYAAFFDIAWRPLKDELRGKVLLPVLGDRYGKILEGGELQLSFDSGRGAFCVSYYAHRFPIDPRSYPQILGHDLAQFESRLGDDARFLEFQSLVAAFEHLPPRTEISPDKIMERHRDKELLKKRLAEMCVDAQLASHIAAAVAMFNDNAHRDRLHALLESQAYRVAYWRTAADEINYRRFFDINDLAGMRMENPQAFFATHRLISELVASGHVTGLRIDHPDGLYDPVAYYHRLQRLVNSAVAKTLTRPTNGNALYLVIEKILAPYEYLPEDWPVHGTTGYDFTNLVNGVLVHSAGERELDRLYSRFIGRTIDFDELLYERKKLIMRVALSSELNVLGNYLNRISESDWDARDYTLTALRNALMEVVACFPVYRTYVTSNRVTVDDRRYVDWAIALAKKRSPAADITIFDFIRKILLLAGLEERSDDYRHAVVDFAMRFQQYTAPVMAKGLEDTSFYAYHRLVSFNEVGGDPRRFGVSVAAFHRVNLERSRRWPHTMLATSSHDSKRSEDVRARIDVLTEVAKEWKEHVMRWSKLNRAKKSKVDDVLAPGRNDEYLLYQTLVGAWPVEELDDAGLERFRERIEAYMLKAAKEAKVHTSWINPNPEYEEAIAVFVRALLAHRERNVFLADFLPFQKRIARAGFFNSLSQTALKLLSPGVPDIYQGSELWDFSLVDPDNRRPVDYPHREKMLAHMEATMVGADEGLAARVRALLDEIEDGGPKLYLIWRVLQWRREHSAEFREAEYVPLSVVGEHAEYLCAFARRHGDWSAAVVVPRCYAMLSPRGKLPIGSLWRDTWVEAPLDIATPYRNVLTGQIVRGRIRDGKAWVAGAELLKYFPIALLQRA